MPRLTKEELEKVKEKYGVDRLYSWSKINCFMTSPYEYYLKYVLHKEEDRTDCIYAPVGGSCHDILESFYNGEIKYEDMIGLFSDSWLTNYDICKLKFDRNDETKNENIAKKYNADLEHFFNNHIVIDRNIALEKFLSAKIGDYVLQGYADALMKDDDDNFVIIDWKSSSKYVGKTLEEKSGQLCVYAIALTQAGVPLDKIKACFNFLKYCTVKCEQKNGTIKTRDIERSKIGESLQNNASMWLKALGYKDEVDDYTKLLIDTNSIEVLPEEVREKYAMSDCYVYIPLTQKLVDKWTETIIATIRDICAREKDYEETKSDKCFWDDDEDVKKESYYFSTLMGYSPKLHKPYSKYLDELDAAKNGNDLFGSLNVGSVNTVVTNKDICDNVTGYNEDDLSWLDDI